MFCRFLWLIVQVLVTNQILEYSVINFQFFFLIFQDEVKEWMFPSNYDPIKAEASHLIHHADADKVSYPEVI